MKMITISEIDAMIVELKKRNIDIQNSKMCIPEWLENNEIRMLILEELKQKAISSIPEKKIDEKIKELKEALIAGPASFTTKDGLEWSLELRDAEIRILEDLKK